jgi:hypothetical protein
MSTLGSELDERLDDLLVVVGETVGQRIDSLEEETRGLDWNSGRRSMEFGVTSAYWHCPNTGTHRRGHHAPGRTALAPLGRPNRHGRVTFLGRDDRRRRCGRRATFLVASVRPARGLWWLPRLGRRPGRRRGARRAVGLISVMKPVLSGPVPSFAGTGMGAAGSTGQGQAVAHMDRESELISGRPFDLSGCAASADP